MAIAIAITIVTTTSLNEHSNQSVRTSDPKSFKPTDHVFWKQKLMCISFHLISSHCQPISAVPRPRPSPKQTPPSLKRLLKKLLKKLLYSKFTLLSVTPPRNAYAMNESISLSPQLVRFVRAPLQHQKRQTHTHTLSLSLSKKKKNDSHQKIIKLLHVK